jgi:hypothetical protein
LRSPSSPAAKDFWKPFLTYDPVAGGWLCRSASALRYASASAVRPRA